ncbi:hypothetical protein [Natrarchaeobaculum sulfurireducens]|uniref:Uncharacterized protein n=1 Tax=Natrarchaeobaculum sulfurireducens TaxID=2044521 RepID=A0A346PPP7_9EURY|nr:hypothetical protein [Natrarchaeobaculum sulfurireducens]AXR81492.1 hypothetical protein AArcMg_1479 [Natrarchaeobaculum sulfurireducens]
MTEHTNAANEQPDDEQASPITFADLQEAENERRRQRKKVIFELPEGDIWFEIRMLTPEEFDQVESAAVEIEEKRNEKKQSVNTTAFKNKLIKEGVTDSSMPDWKNTDRHINILPKNVRNELADAIDEFQELDEETRYGFR